LKNLRGIHWFRNDLRLQDNTALSALAARAEEWLPVFILDPRILADSRSQQPRTRFLLDCLTRLGRDLDRRSIPLLVRRGDPARILPRLMHETGASLVSFNKDISAFARRRDAGVEGAVQKAGGEVISRLDHVAFDSSEIRKQDGGSYSVYTPYKKSWWRHWHQKPRLPLGPVRLPAPIPGFSSDPIPDAGDRQRESDACQLPTGGSDAAKRRLNSFLELGARRYHEDRDRPDLDGTSRLSPYLRFGAISVRQCIERAQQAARAERVMRSGVRTWIDELIWRDFYSAILEEHPRVSSENHRREYDSLEWNEDDRGFEAWCEGLTGYPIVDAGMRQLRATGWMHNRVRMIVASFLTKDLLIDWRRGERFFFRNLVDGDPASNNGGWQWAASTGTDAQPYFRIFNPVVQGRRWDPRGDYVRRWIPELRKLPAAQVHAPWETSLPDSYPAPLVDHAERRNLALLRFKQARQRSALL
jgi:deoxyribodipyrimidine photo-lyase